MDSPAKCPEIVHEEGAVLLTLGQRRWIPISIVAAIVLLGVGYYFAPIGEACSLRSCQWPEIMMDVARAQLAVEQRIHDGTQPSVGSQSLQSKHLSIGYTLASGAIVVANHERDLLVVFEPTRRGTGGVEWRCYGKPPFLFDPSYLSGASDCGERYRKTISR